MSTRICAIYLRNGEYSKYLSEFEEDELIASGGFGTVVKCTNKLDNKVYAVKKISVVRSGMSADRVLREAQVLAGMEHPNIVRYYHTWVESHMSGVTGDHVFSTSESESECVYILMKFYDRILRNMRKYLPSRSLKALLEDKKQLKTLVADGSALQLFKECVSAVSYIHSKCYLHGDLSAANIFLECAITKKVGDFGLARPVGEDGSVLLSNSLGHEMYRAPECGYRTRGLNTESRPVIKVGTKADMFSLGVILAQMVHSKKGKSVFEGLREIGMPAMWKNGLYGPVLATLLSKNPDDPSAAELLLEIDYLQSSGGPSVSVP